MWCKMAAKKKSKKGGRLHLRINAELAEEMHAYAERHSTNLTSIVTSYFLNLLDAEKLRNYPEAEQI